MHIPPYWSTFVDPCFFRNFWLSFGDVDVFESKRQSLDERLIIMLIQPLDTFFGYTEIIPAEGIFILNLLLF